MKQKEKAGLRAGIGFLVAFLIWTLLIRYVDVRAAGPGGTKIGLAAFNLWFHRLTGVHMTVYTVTDWLGLVPIGVCLCFGVEGALQTVKRRSVRRVDPDLILLGVYYILVILAYLIFEMIPINCRPVLINGVLEASYPSSTTLLVLSVMPTLKFQIDRRCGKVLLRKAAGFFSVAFSVFMVVGRSVAGVHWATDIIGAVLLSRGLIRLYRYAVALSDRHREVADGIQ